jgi:hypothetical protein
MGKLFDTLRALVSEEKYIIGSHASERRVRLQRDLVLFEAKRRS